MKPRSTILTFLTALFLTGAGSLSIAKGGVTNAMLANPSTTVNGITCTLGSGCTMAAGENELQYRNRGRTALAAVPNVAAKSVLASTSSSTPPARQIKPYIDGLDQGAIGNDTNDDTEALNNACTAAFANNPINPMVYLRAGVYKTTSRITCGLSTQTNGFVLMGSSSGNGSQIHYVGSTSDGALYIQNCQYCVIANIRVVDGNSPSNGSPNQSAFGVWFDANNSSAGGASVISNVLVSGFNDGFREGHSPITDTNSIPNNSWEHVQAIGSYIGFHFYGSNGDGQFLRHVSGLQTQYFVRCESCRNLHIDGIEYTGFSAPKGDSSILLYADGGNIGGGGYSMKNARIEQSPPTLAWFGEQNAVADLKQVNVELDNITIASAHAVQTVAGPPSGTPRLTPSSSGGSLDTATWNFEVTALDCGMGESAAGTEATTIVSSGAANSVTVAWSRVTNACYYRVYVGRNGAPDRFWQVWAPTTSLDVTSYGAVDSYVGANRVPSSSSSGNQSAVVWFGETGTLSVSNSTLPNAGSFFAIPRLGGTAFATLKLDSNQINNPSPESPFATVKAYGAGTAGGGVIYQARNNIIIDNDFNQLGKFVNRQVLYGSDTSETVQADLDTIESRFANPPSPRFPMLAPDGTCTNPSYSFTNEITLGLARQSGGTLAYCGGTHYFYGHIYPSADNAKNLGYNGGQWGAVYTGKVTSETGKPLHLGSNNTTYWTVDTSGNLSGAGHLNQNATGNWAGTCIMSSSTSCTITLSAAYAGTPGCVVSQQGTGTVIAGECSVSGKTVTITAAASNSATWAAMLFGNPN